MHLCLQDHGVILTLLSNNVCDVLRYAGTQYIMYVNCNVLRYAGTQYIMYIMC